MPKDIKLLKNEGQQYVVLKYDFETSQYKPIEKLGNNIHLKFITDNNNKKIGINAEDSTSTYFQFYLNAFRAYQCAPDPEIRFSGSIEELMDIFINDLFGSALSGSGFATEAKQQEIINKVEEVNQKAGEILTLTDLELWEYTAGNSKEFVYYTQSIPGSDPDNLSGSDKNIKFIIYKQGVSTVITQQLFFDNLNRIVKIQPI